MTLSDVDSLRSIPQSDDMTYFQFHLKGMVTKSKTSRRLQDSSMTETRLELLLRNPLGPIFNLANHLQSVVGDIYAEKQVYRIDHYLGKDTVNNILAPVLSNTLLEPLWNRNYIEEVQIFATETIGCDGSLSTTKDVLSSS